VRLLLGVAVAVAALWHIPAGVAAPACYTNWQGKPELNVATQFGTDDAAVHAAISAAQAADCGVYFTSTTFHYSSPLVLDGLRAYGDGPSSVLQASDPNNSAVFLAGNGPQIHNLQITAPTASSRGDDWENAGVMVKGATGFVVDHVTVDRVRGVGIFDFGGAFGSITSNTVRNALADGIHNAHGAHNVDLAFNTVTNAGDDLISVVSYTFDDGACHDISVHDNTVSTQPWGRGIALVGGQSIRIVRNSISDTYGAGIYIASEPGWLSTVGVSGAVVSDNTIRYPDQSGTHWANIRVWGGDPGFPVGNVSGVNNRLDRSKPGVRADGSISNIAIGWTYE
jgi:putative cofactor-binding repeat protein